MSNKVEIIIQGIDQTSQIVGNIGKNFLGLGRTLGGIALGGIGLLTAGVTAASAALIATIPGASDLNETISKTEIVFGSSAKQILDWGKTTAASIGMSTNEALTAAGIYGNLFRAIGIGEQNAADMSQQMVVLAGDLASFNNASPEEVLNALRSGLVGETEPLKRFGINLSAAALKEKALSMGLKVTKGELDANVKAQAAYALIMEQTSLAQGDFSRTSKGLANSQRILKASLTNVSNTIGTAILPVAAKIAGIISTIVTSDRFTAFINTAADALGEFADKALRFIDNIDWVAVFNTVQTGWENFKTTVMNVWNAVSPILSEIWNTFQVVWNKISGILKNGITPEDISGFLSLFADIGNEIGRLFGLIDWGKIITDVYNGLLSVGNAILTWADDIDLKGKIWEKLVEIATSIGVWASDPKTHDDFYNAGKTVGTFLGDALELAVKAAAALIGSWFSDPKNGFETNLKIAQVCNSIAGNLVAGLVAGFVKGLTGQDISKELSDWLKDNIAKAFYLAAPAYLMGVLFRQAIDNAFSGQFASKSPYSPSSAVQYNYSPSVHGRASGGSVNAGEPYIVGENGKELFVPNSDGYVMSHSKYKSMVSATAPVAARGGRGASIVLNYSPTISLADKAEASERLLPFIREGLRAAGVA